ncbi:MAG: hypothetical protein HY047_13485 [Acidobacteria bacterium]|nr:hypothetical protein [Acidobacteriota bacterium]
MLMFMFDCLIHGTHLKIVASHTAPAPADKKEGGDREIAALDFRSAKSLALRLR